MLESWKGNEISIWDDRWIPGIDTNECHNRTDNEDLKLVSDPIDFTNKKWKTNLINNTFQVEIAQKILQIPLAGSLLRKQIMKTFKFGKENCPVNTQYEAPIITRC